MEIEIQALTEKDIPAAMELKNALGWNQTPADWRRFLRLSPQGSFKAVRGEELVGTAIAFIFDKVSWIGMVMVKKGCRHQGVGRELMRCCLEHSAQAGCSLVKLDATREGMPLYRSLGFQPEYLVATARGTIAARPEMRPAGENLRLQRITRTDLEEVVTLEAAAVGAVREALLNGLVEQNPGCGFVARKATSLPGAAGGLAGFVLYRHGLNFLQVGPLIASSEAAAGMLLRAAFEDRPAPGGSTAVSLTVPMSQPAMPELLRSWGLTPEPRLTRMYRGRKRLHAREDMVYALSGPEKG